MDLREKGSGNPEEHWYYYHKSRLILQSVKRYASSYSPLIDVGSGSGFFAKEIRDNFASEEIYCIDPNYAPSEIGCIAGINYQIDFPKCKGNLYLFIDVLEHVSDDRALLSSYVSNSNPKSIFILSVPAFMSLWSPHDVFLGHFKRYKLIELETLAKECQLEILEARYLFGPIFPLVYLYRKLRRNRQPSSDIQVNSRFANAILKKVLWMDLHLKFNRAFGTSAYVVAKAVKGDRLMINEDVLNRPGGRIVR